MKVKYLLLFLFFSSIYAQNDKGDFKNESKKVKDESEDFQYEIKHKSKSWFSNMKDGVDYFDIKKKYDSYFGNHNWEKSKLRSLGEDWLKSKIFYLDKNGIVQPEPTLSVTRKKVANLTQTVVGTWTMLGPINSATTNYSGKGNHGGYVYLNRIDPTNTQKMFVAFVTGGLWMTIDGGVNWVLTDSNFADETYNDIDVCISNPQIAYALSTKQLLKSIDGGLTWQATSLNSTNYTGIAYDIAVSPINPDIVIARWGDKIYKTTNGGTTWASIITGLPNYSTWDCSIHSEMLDWSTTNNSVVYFLSTSNNNQFKLYRSSDSGVSFSVVSTITLDAAANGQIIGWTKLLLPSNNASSIYVAVGTGSSAYNHLATQLYKLNATTGVQELLRTNLITGIGDSYANDPVLHHGDITMDRNNENKIAYGAYGNNKIHYSIDNGLTFSLSSTSTHSDIRTLSMVDNKLLVGSDGESVLSIDGGFTTSTVTNSISNHELWGFGSAFKSDLVASGNNHGPVMIKEAANGFDWYNGTGADQGNTDVNPLDDRYIYSQGYSNYRYFRTGLHTLINEPNYLDLGGIYNYFNSIEFHPNKYYSMITHHAGQYPTGNPNLATWKNSLIKTEDNGNSISIVKTFGSPVFREKISMKNPDYMYVVEGISNNKLWKTTDAGLTWLNITPSSAVSSGQTNISDIAISDVNPNEIWVTYSGVQTTCKILKSSDYGATWINLTTPNLTSFPITKIIFQRGSNGGVYIGSKMGVYYRNNTSSTWNLLGNGLPQSEIRFMFINYNKGKLKIGTSRGAFEHDLYEISLPNALISVNSNKITCPLVEKLQFKDYSVVRNATATWAWSFPGGTPASSTLENPEVSYANAANGFYNVSLTVTDTYGTSSQTLTNFIEVNNLCGTATPDGIPGNSAKLTGQISGDYIEVNDLNLNKNSFTFSCWIKPNGIQTDYSALFMTQTDTNAFGLNFISGNNTLGFHPNWSWSSGLQTPDNQWSHVALVSNGTNVKIYVNGIESVNNTAMPSEVITSLFIGNYGRGRGDRFTNLEIDEVSIWNRPLAIDEIRKYRHLTKSNSAEPIQNGLVAYYQFNETAGSVSINKTTNLNVATYKGIGYLHSLSNTPVFGGLSEKININSAGVKDFSTVGLVIDFQSGTYPNGDLWVSRGGINPDVLPDTFTSLNSYTIVNNYGTNQTISSLQSITFKNNLQYSISSTPSTFSLYKRGSNSFGSTWGTILDTGDSITGSGATTTVTFSSGLSMTSFSQFVLSNTNTLSTESFVKSSKPSFYPNPIKNNQPLKINLPLDWESSTLIIYDSIGKKVSQSSLTKENNEILLNLPVGTYYFVIYNENNKFSDKIIVR